MGKKVNKQPSFKVSVKCAGYDWIENVQVIASTPQLTTLQFRKWRGRADSMMVYPTSSIIKMPVVGQKGDVIIAAVEAIEIDTFNASSIIGVDKNSGHILFESEDGPNVVINPQYFVAESKGEKASKKKIKNASSNKDDENDEDDN